MSNKKDFELIEDYGILRRTKGGYTNHFILARWGKHPPCYEIRTFKDGEPMNRAGIAPDELPVLKEILETIVWR